MVDENGTTVAVSSLPSSNINNSVIVFKWSNENFYQPTSVLFPSNTPNISSQNAVLFGNALDINSNGSLVAITAPYYSNPKSQNGAVFVFREKNDGTWEQIGPALIGNNSIVDEALGSTVCVDALGSTIVVGGYFRLVIYQEVFEADTSINQTTTTSPTTSSDINIAAEINLTVLIACFSLVFFFN